MKCIGMIWGYIFYQLFITGFTSQTSFNSYFEYKTNTVVLNKVVEGRVLIFTSTTLLKCVIHCQQHRCTSLIHDKSTGGGECIIYKLPLKELIYSSSNVVSGKDTLVIKPCTHQNTNCLHGGVCSKNVSSIKGYDCKCIGEWTGELCEEGIINLFLFYKFNLVSIPFFFPWQILLLQLSISKWLLKKDFVIISEMSWNSNKRLKTRLKRK